MKKIIIITSFLVASFFGYSQDTITTYKKVVIAGDSTLVKTYTINRVVKDTVKRKELREQLERVNQSIGNNATSRKIQNAEFDRLDIYYKKERTRIKAELAK